MIATKTNPINELGISVYSGRIARELLRKGYRIIDLKPNKADKKLSVFIFAIEGNLSQDIQILIEQQKL